MTRIRRGGYVFVTWIGDHQPKHVHVFRHDEPVVKWDLKRGMEISGQSSAKIRRLIHELQNEGLL